MTRAVQVIDDPRSTRALLVLQYMAGGGLVSRRAIDEATLRRMHPDIARIHFRNIARVRVTLRFIAKVLGASIWKDLIICYKATES